VSTPTSERTAIDEPLFERERVSEWLADRLDRPLTIAGFAFLLIVLADLFVARGTAAGRVLEVTGWLLWGLFVVEFLVRLFIAPSTSEFLRRNWWQVIFLAVPFLRFLRPVARLRVPRLGRVVSSAVRSSRTAARTLSGRLSWLSVLTGIVVLAASQIAFEFGDFASYGNALHRAALATVTGTSFGQDVAVLQVLDVVLGVYSVVVFAALAAMLGAFFVDRRVET
jgi:voltage-gated potassium channel